ncbi:hypothetical protein WOLCODRAFT_150564 [Wolfiporia cocos MD-104 SS10]|uniref:Uncharacterized protein n=1 Tax=Wolfiporia cocos (strain MD-104) TaxID=742152 RepID=A0A2H3JE33_WOLCO|nr:hypothetical protein WOLCODRAFT_150564 [Wolfiporia cocos MD-104 SS10]
MGGNTWRASELLFLKAQWTSNTVRKIYRKTASLKSCSNFIYDKFLEEFGKEPYEEETDAEFQARLALVKSAATQEMQTKWPAETREMCEMRLKRLSDRIYGFVRHRSPNKGKGKGRKIGEGMALFAERRDVSAWDVWRKHKGVQKKAEREYSREVSDHAEEGTSEVLGGAQWTKAAMEEYATLSHEEKARLQEEADRANKERREVEFNGNNEFIRAEKVRNLGEILGKLAKQIEEELGWVVLFMAGGVDEMGNVSDLIHTTAKQSNGKDFITHLAEQLQISPPRLGNEWFNFIEDIYDPVSVQRTGEDRGQESGDTTKTVDSTKAGGDGEFNKGKDTMTTPWEVEDSGEGTSNIGSGASNVTSSEGDVLRGEGDDGGRLDVATDGGEALCAIDTASRPSTENSHSTDDMADRMGQRKLESGGDVQMAAGEASQEVLRAFSGSQCAGEAAVKASGARGALGKAAQKKSTRGKLWADSSAEQVTDTIPMIAGRGARVRKASARALGEDG